MKIPIIHAVNQGETTYPEMSDKVSINLTGFAQLAQKLQEQDIKADEQALNEIFNCYTKEKDSVSTEDFANGISKVYGVEVNEEMIDAISEMSELDGDDFGLSKTDIEKSKDADFDAMISSGAVNDALTEVLNNIVIEEEKSFNKTKENNGVISKGWDWIKNKTGLGQGSDKTQSKIDNAKEQLAKLKEHPEKLKEVYKEITGNELDATELEAMYNGEVDFSDSDIINSVNKYQSSQKTGVNVFSGVVSALTVTGLVVAGVVAAPFTGGISLGASLAAIGTLTAAGTAAYMVPQAVDGFTEKDGYSGKEAFEDFAHGAVNSAITAASLGAGQAIGTALSGGEAAAAGAAETAASSAIMSKTAAGFVQSEATALMMGDGVAAGDYIVDVALDKDRDFSLKELGMIEASATAASLAAGGTAVGANALLRPVLTSGSTASSQVAGRFLSSAISGGAAGTTGALAAGSTNYLLNCKVNGEDINFEDWLDATTENAAGGAITGFAGGIAFEAVQFTAGAPKPEGTVKIQKGITDDGLNYKEYLDADGNVIARDFNGKELSNFIKGQNPSVDNQNATRTVRVSTNLKTAEFEMNGIKYDATASQKEIQFYDWAGNAPTGISLKPEIEYQPKEGQIGSQKAIDAAQYKAIEDKSALPPAPSGPDNAFKPAIINPDEIQSVTTAAKNNVSPYFGEAAGEESALLVPKRIQRNSVSEEPLRISELDKSFEAFGITAGSEDNSAVQNVPETQNAVFDLMQHQLRSVTEADVNDMLSTIMKSGATKDEALLTLGKLTSYGNMLGLKSLADTLSSKYQIGEFFTDNDNMGISANTALNYVGAKKQQIGLNPQSTKQAFILDDFGLKYLEELKTTNPERFDAIINNPDIEFINVEGWNEGTNIYGQTSDAGRVTDTARDLTARAKEVQASEGGSFNDALSKVINEQTLQRADALGIPKVVTVKPIDEISGYTPDTIACNLQPMSISQEKFEATVDAMAKSLFPKSQTKAQKAKELITGYLRESLDIYSPQRLGDKMGKMKSAIIEQASKLQKSDGSNFGEDDIFYIIPEKNKSYTQIALQYATVNGIDSDKFIYATGKEMEKLPDNRVYVVLDDVIGSGASILTQPDGFRYSSVPRLSVGNRHIIISPIVSGESGYRTIKNYIETSGRGGKDFILISDSQIKKSYQETDFYKNLSKKDKKMLDQILEDVGKGASYGPAGYGKQSYAICFPYMTPDNNAALPSLLFDNLLLNPDASSALKNHYSESNKTVKEVLENIQYID